MLFRVVPSFISFVCLLALSHLLEITCLSKGKDEGGKEAEWELSAVMASVVHVLYFLKISLKPVEMSAETHALLSPPARRSTPLLLGYFWQCDTMQEGEVTRVSSFLMESGELH